MTEALLSVLTGPAMLRACRSDRLRRAVLLRACLAPRVSPLDASSDSQALNSGDAVSLPSWQIAARCPPTSLPCPARIAP